MADVAEPLIWILLTLLNPQFMLSLLLEFVEIHKVLDGSSSLVEDVSLRVRLLGDLRHLTDLFVTVNFGIEI